MNTVAGVCGLLNDSIFEHRQQILNYSSRIISGATLSCENEPHSEAAVSDSALLTHIQSLTDKDVPR